jgi:hypothetical protein
MKRKRITGNLMLLAMMAFWIFSSDSSDTFAAQKAAKQKHKAIKKSAVQVIELRNTDQVKDAFQGDKGKVRLVTILSPT